MSGGATKTTCPYCGVGCGILARPLSDGTAEIAGDPEHPANFGRLCSKGAALGETLSLDGRLLYPAFPYTSYQRIYGLNAVRVTRTATTLPVQIALVPREGVPQEEALADVDLEDGGVIGG